MRAVQLCHHRCRSRGRTAPEHDAVTRHAEILSICCHLRTEERVPERARPHHQNGTSGRSEPIAIRCPGTSRIAELSPACVLSRSPLRLTPGHGLARGNAASQKASMLIAAMSGTQTLWAHLTEILSMEFLGIFLRVNSSAPQRYPNRIVFIESDTPPAHLA